MFQQLKFLYVKGTIICPFRHLRMASILPARKLRANRADPSEYRIDEDSRKFVENLKMMKERPQDFFQEDEDAIVPQKYGYIRYDSENKKLWDPKNPHPMFESTESGK